MDEGSIPQTKKSCLHKIMSNNEGFSEPSSLFSLSKGDFMTA